MRQEDGGKREAIADQVYGRNATGAVLKCHKHTHTHTLTQTRTRTQAQTRTQTQTHTHARTAVHCVTALDTLHSMVIRVARVGLDPLQGELRTTALALMKRLESKHSAGTYKLINRRRREMGGSGRGEKRQTS